jgi:hypothetical protein
MGREERLDIGYLCLGSTKIKRQIKENIDPEGDRM